LFLDAPFVGHGPRTFVLSYQAYLEPTDDNRLTPWAHNLYLELLAEQGVIGLLALIGILFTIFSAIWRVLCILNLDRTNERIFATCVFASLMSYCVAGIFEISLIRQWAVMVLFLLAAVACFFQNLIGNKNESDKN
jgi:O-antigen ligase